MRIEDVPQDPSLTAEGLNEISYAVDNDGRYSLVQSTGWEPKGIVLNQAWEVIVQQMSDVLDKVKAGKLSPLAYHMARHQMKIGLLAKYVDFPWWKVWLHLRPAGFRHLERSVLERYADAFGISVEQLNSIPENLNLEFYKNKDEYGSY